MPLEERKKGRSSVSGTYTTSYTTRGNATRISRRLLSSGIDYHTYQNFDIAGNVVRVKDARGYSTNLYYNDRFGSPDAEARANSVPFDLAGQISYAFVTQVVTRSITPVMLNSTTTQAK